MTEWAGLQPPLDPALIIGKTDVGAVLVDTLSLLQEASDYLKRLPRVPITQQLIAKLEAHQLAPATLTARRVAEQLEHEKLARCAAAYTTYGLPIIECEVQGNALRMKLGHAPSSSARAIAMLEAGCELQLEPKTSFRPPRSKRS
ncbi:hypothetical protein [Comamonas thiooxydans]|uniref:hypothetical protein n=1 Tax=Comamonas thiooxydans TaxID=363952 RepID=UPI000B41E10A|nr:hypothetical protein [Comamonas thiooxydans]